MMTCSATDATTWGGKSFQCRGGFLQVVENNVRIVTEKSIEALTRCLR
jgi:hypothetical protein